MWTIISISAISKVKRKSSKSLFRKGENRLITSIDFHPYGKPLLGSYFSRNRNYCPKF